MRPKHSIISSLTKSWIVIVLQFLIQSPIAMAQPILMGTSVNTLDSKGVFANPALMSYQSNHVAVGLKGYHLGYFDSSLLDYQKGYISFVLPSVAYSRLGSGINIQYFNSPILSKSQIGTTFSYRIVPNVSVGVNASLLYMGYNRNNFVDFDFDDPVFAGGFSKFTFNTSAGVYARPIPFIEIGAGARNINQPDIALGFVSAPMPLEPFAGFSLRYGPLKGIFEVVNTERGLEKRSHIELYSSTGYYGRIGTTTDFSTAYIELQGRLFSGYSANYQYELPSQSISGLSNGSHMFSLVYEFNRKAKLPSLKKHQIVHPPYVKSAGKPIIPPNVFLNNDVEYLILSEIHITRSLDDSTVTASDLQILTAYDLGIMGEYPGFDRIPYKDRNPVDVPALSRDDDEPGLSADYEKFLETIREYMSKDKNLSLNILTQVGGEVRGSELRSIINRDTSVPISISNILLSDQVDSTLFVTPIDINMLQEERLIKAYPLKTTIKPLLYGQVESSNWVLLITDPNDFVLKEIKGIGQIPDNIDWDWKIADDRYIEPGVYYYSLKWTEPSTGVEKKSRKRVFYVQKNLRKVDVTITKDPSKLPDGAESINIIMKKN